MSATFSVSLEWNKSEHITGSIPSNLLLFRVPTVRVVEILDSGCTRHGSGRRAMNGTKKKSLNETHVCISNKREECSTVQCGQCFAWLQSKNWWADCCPKPRFVGRWRLCVPFQDLASWFCLTSDISCYSLHYSKDGRKQTHLRRCLERYQLRVLNKVYAPSYRRRGTVCMEYGELLQYSYGTVDRTKLSSAEEGL